MAFPYDIDVCEELPQIATIDVVDYDRIQAMITESKEAICGCSEVHIGAVSTDVKQIMLGLGDSIVENTTLIKSHSGITIIA